jgi:hypothetical protein
MARLLRGANDYETRIDGYEDSEEHQFLIYQTLVISLLYYGKYHHAGGTSILLSYRYRNVVFKCSS